jgi:hypothetical protein
MAINGLAGKYSKIDHVDIKTGFDRLSGGGDRERQAGDGYGFSVLAKPTS